MKNCLRSWRLSADSKTNAYGSKVIGGRIYGAELCFRMLACGQELRSSSTSVAQSWVKFPRILLARRIRRRRNNRDCFFAPRLARCRREMRMVNQPHPGLMNDPSDRLQRRNGAKGAGGRRTPLSPQAENGRHSLNTKWGCRSPDWRRMAASASHLTSPAGGCGRRICTTGRRGRRDRRVKRRRAAAGAAPPPRGRYLPSTARLPRQTVRIIGAPLRDVVR